MLTIEYKDGKGKKIRWTADGTRNEIRQLVELFGEGKEVKPRNPYGPRGMPADVVRERGLALIAKAELKEAG